MTTSPGTSVLSRIATANRFVWLLLAAAHVPAVASSWGSLTGEDQVFSRLIGVFGLLITEVFFLLKVVDAPFLRLQLNRHAWVALLMGAALIHVDTLPPPAGDSTVPNAPVIVATTLIVGGIAFSRRPLPGLALRANPKRNHCHAQLLRWASASVGSYSVPGFLLASRLHALRGPPA